MSALIWFTTDLRLRDNEALVRAVEHGEEIIPVYCYDPRQYRQLELGFPKTSAKRLAFLNECLLDLRSQLQALGSDLYLAVGKPEEVIPDLCRKNGITTVFGQKDIPSEEVAVETALAEALKGQSISLELIWGKTLYHIDDAPFPADEAPLTSKAFRIQLTKGAQVRALLPKPDAIPTVTLREWGTLATPTELGLAEEAFSLVVPGGETAGLERLRYYTFESDLVQRYKFTRNRSLGLDYSSKLSAYLAMGCISPREVYWTVKRYEKEVKRNISTWWLVFEVMWREYFQYQGLRVGNKMFFIGGRKGKEVDFNENYALFERWRKGETGIPFVDAHMRELATTGFMSNRGRVNTASFFSRDYQVDWRWGAAWFESQLLDYDVCSNWLNWNTQAMEIYYTNPVWQGVKYDKKGEYVRTQLPELAQLPDYLVQAPWLMEQQKLAALGAGSYPKPHEVYKKWNRAQGIIRKKSAEIEQEE